MVHNYIEYVYCYSGSLQIGRNINLLQYLSQHNIRLLASPHTVRLVLTTIMMESGVFCPLQMTLNQIEHPAGKCHNLYLWQVLTLLTLLLFLSEIMSHTPQFMLSLSRNCFSRNLLTNLQFVGVVGHTSVLNLSSLHISMKLLLLVRIHLYSSDRSFCPITHSVRQWRSSSTGLTDCPPGTGFGGQYTQYRWSLGTWGLW